jgi:signal transduction histidine kinase
MKLTERALQLVDWFIPAGSKAARSELGVARIFVATHLLGPTFSQSIGLYLLFAEQNPNWVVYTIIGAICSFWVIPLVLKYTKSLQASAFLSFNMLAMTAFFGSFFYGGVTSPFLPWVIISLLLGFFYLSNRQALVFICFGFQSLAFYFAQLLLGFPTRVNPDALVTLGWISIFGAVAYMSWMAIYYSTVVSGRHDVELELKRHKLTAQGLQEAREIADHANQTRSIFLAKMSHELRTPLNAVIGYSELLLESCEDANASVQKQKDLQRIAAAGKHLLSLVDQVLDLSKIESNIIDVRTELMEIDRFIHDVEATVLPLMEKNGNRFDVKIPAKAGTMLSDPTMIRQILLNLLGNAAKFTRNGDISLHVRKMRVGLEDWVELAVIDTGIGIAPDVLPKLFASFAQASASTSAQFGGTGIGLAVTRKLCTLLGGQVLVSSEPGAGSKFTVRLPAIYKPDTAKDNELDHEHDALAA